jgi:hypothetical protein
MTRLVTISVKIQQTGAFVSFALLNRTSDTQAVPPGTFLKRSGSVRSAWQF